jgi:hypothetical protein
VVGTVSAIVHDFTASLEQGLEGEAYLDAYFSKWYAIHSVSHMAQRSGIDRWFRPHTEPARLIAVEYKTDARANQTGNAFIETESVAGKKQGWAYTSRADILIYRITEPDAIYILPMPRLRSALPGWLARYRTVNVQNPTYVTVGVLVPLLELERIAEGVMG